MIALIPIIQGMIRALHSEHEDAEGINNYVGCYSWDTAITELFTQFQASGVLAENDVKRLWGLLAEDIPREMRYLKAVYMPTLEDVLEIAGIVAGSDKPADGP
jgi:hypothetical protein